MDYRIAEITLTGITQMIQAQSAEIQEPHDKRKEKHDQYDTRTWPLRMHKTEDGYVYVPAFAIKRAMENTAKFLGMKVPGQKMKTFGNYFKAATIVESDLVTSVKAADVPGKGFYVPSDGISGGGKRVMRMFPIIPSGWTGKVKITVLDVNITNEVFQEHIEAAGMFNGLGTWRPQVGGTYGRFKLDDIKWYGITE